MKRCAALVNADAAGIGALEDELCLQAGDALLASGSAHEGRGEMDDGARRRLRPVSYTHLTLPANREV